MCQGLPQKPDHLSSIPGTHIVEGREPIPQVVESLHACSHAPGLEMLSTGRQWVLNLWSPGFNPHHKHAWIQENTSCTHHMQKKKSSVNRMLAWYVQNPGFSLQHHLNQVWCRWSWKEQKFKAIFSYIVSLRSNYNTWNLLFKKNEVEFVVHQLITRDTLAEDMSSVPNIHIIAQNY